MLKGITKLTGNICFALIINNIHKYSVELLIKLNILLYSIEVIHTLTILNYPILPIQFAFLKSSFSSLKYIKVPKGVNINEVNKIYSLRL